jgi:chromosome segregation ATPase
MKKSRMDDFIEFNKRCEHLRLAWHAEKETLDREIGHLEMKLEEQRILQEAQHTADQKHIASLKASLETLGQENTALGQKDEGRVAAFEKQINEKDEAVGALSRKIELLQAELERRDQILKTGFQENVTLNKLVNDLKAGMKHQADTMAIQSQNIENLNLRLRIVSEERDTMRTSWQREQAEWRELWERNRELFDKKK